MSFLWPFANQPPLEMTMNEKIEYHLKSLDRLTDFLLRIPMESNLRPSAVNITFSIDTKEQTVRCMFGTSMRCQVPTNEQSVETRVRNMMILQLAAVDIEDALTEDQLASCSHPLGNCAELITWEAMRREQNSNQENVILYTRTLIIPRKNRPPKIIAPCSKCQHVILKMESHQLATIHQY